MLWFSFVTNWFAHGMLPCALNYTMTSKPWLQASLKWHLVAIVSYLEVNSFIYIHLFILLELNETILNMHRMAILYFMFPLKRYSLSNTNSLISWSKIWKNLLRDRSKLSTFPLTTLFSYELRATPTHPNTPLPPVNSTCL